MEGKKETRKTPQGIKTACTCFFVVTETGKRRRRGEVKGKEEEEKDSLLFLNFSLESRLKPKRKKICLSSKTLRLPFNQVA